MPPVEVDAESFFDVIGDPRYFECLCSLRPLKNGILVVRKEDEAVLEDGDVILEMTVGEDCEGVLEDGDVILEINGLPISGMREKTSTIQKFCFSGIQHFVLLQKNSRFLNKQKKFHFLLPTKS